MTLDEVSAHGIHVDTTGALLELHLSHAPKLRGPAEVLQRRVYGVDGLTYTRNSVSIAALRRRYTTSGAFDPWEALAHDYLSAWTTGDPAAVAELYAPDARVVDTVAGLALTGRADIARHARRLRVERTGDLSLATIRGTSDPALYLNARLPQLAGTLGLVYRVDDGDGCTATIATSLVVRDGVIVRERRFHDVPSARRCLQDLPGGWWDVVTVPPDPVASLLQIGGRRVEVHGSTPALDGLLAWAADRFIQAGLAPPPLASVTFATATGQCAGVAGRARLRDAGVDLTLCFDEARACQDEACTTYTRFARLTLLHELAHAWEHASLDDRAREAYLERAGVDSWNDPDQPWGDRGAERAAETLMWGLMDEDVRVPRIGAPPCSVLAADYRLLTGREPLRPPCR